MANDVKLQEGHPVDENLRPLKVGGKATSLELSQYENGNGARVNGDLEITGDINKKELNLDKITATGDHTIFAGGDIILDGGGLTVGASIVLDSHVGNFAMKKAGTEFSAANSAYAGMILGYTAIGIDAASASEVVAGTFAVTDAAHKVTFIAPPSGNVEIFVSVSAIAVTQRWIQFGLSDNATYAAIDFPNSDDVTNEHNIIDLQIDGYPRILTNNWAVEGLTAGTEYTWWLGAETEQAGRMTLWWGGNSSGGYPPFIMKAIALPATIYTG